MWRHWGGGMFNPLVRNVVSSRYFSVCVCGRRAVFVCWPGNFTRSSQRLIGNKISQLRILRTLRPGGNRKDLRDLIRNHHTNLNCDHLSNKQRRCTSIVCRWRSFLRWQRKQAGIRRNTQVQFEYLRCTQVQ